MGKELSSHWHSGRERKKLKRKVVWGLRKGHDRLSNFWVYCSHQHSSELTSNYLDECAYAGVHVNEYVCVVDCVPQWCWGQQCPGMAVWTRERPGAQLTDDWGHRLTSQTAIKGTKYEYYLKVRQKHTHTHTHEPAHVVYHSGTVDSSCWWCSDPQPEFLHSSKLEWARYMTHTLLREKTNKNIHRFTAVIKGTSN